MATRDKQTESETRTPEGNPPGLGAMSVAVALVLCIGLAWAARQWPSGSGVAESADGTAAVTGMRPRGVVAAAPESLSWGAVSGAVRYRVTVGDGAGGILGSTELDDPSWALPAQVVQAFVPLRSHGIRVEAFGKNGELLASSSGWTLRVESPRPLGLRPADGAAVPGDVAAVVLHTDAPLGFAAGEILLRGGPPALVELLAGEVFSLEGDAVADAAYDPDQGTTRLTFTSPSAGANFDAGPLAVLFYRVSETVPAGTTVELAVDGAETELRVDDEQVAELEVAKGTLEVVEPSAPLRLSLRAEPADPGGQAEVALVSRRSLPLAKGDLVLLFDPESASGEGAEIIEHYRYGSVRTRLSRPAPGRLRLSFVSPAGDLNRVPGEILRLRLPISPSADPGSSFTVRLGPASSVEAADGRTPALERLPGEIEIRTREEVFADGFEGGVLRRWRLVVP